MCAQTSMADLTYECPNDEPHGPHHTVASRRLL